MPRHAHRSAAPVVLLWLAATPALAACGGGARAPSDEPAAPAPASAPAGGEADGAPAAVNMAAHFTDVAIARDAVIAGDLEATRAPLRRIAAATYRADLPADWQSWVGEMQTIARDAADAATLEASAAAVADLGLRCGQCHRDTYGGPPDAETPPPDPAGAATPAAQRMRAHAWGTEQLWLGLTGPSYGAWVRGAQAIADPGETRGTPLGTSLVGLQELAARAALASRPQQRATMYADLLARCAGCHSAQGIRPRAR